MSINEESKAKQIERLELAGMTVSEEALTKYISSPDDLGELADGMDIPDGFKKCGHCNHILKLYMFNVNNSSKNKCTGNCKKCQKLSAKKSYDKTKGSRNYKEYYQNNKEKKQEHGRKYYQENKDKILEKQKEYHTSKVGKKVMKKAHKKRKKLMEQNKGVPYEREWVIDRDKLGGDRPICYICEKPVMFDRELHLDHVVGITLGGLECFTNVACSHQICNLQKTKDCRELEVEKVEAIIERAENYIDEHPELFDKKI